MEEGYPLTVGAAPRAQGPQYGKARLVLGNEGVGARHLRAGGLLAFRSDHRAGLSSPTLAEVGVEGEKRLFPSARHSEAHLGRTPGLRHAGRATQSIFRGAGAGAEEEIKWGTKACLPPPQPPPPQPPSAL